MVEKGFILRGRSAGRVLERCCWGCDSSVEAVRRVVLEVVLEW